jgi:hypothetical protein
MTEEPELGPRSDESSSSTRRRGKARERVRRRREREKMGLPANARTLRQLSPAGGFQLPNIDLRIVRAVGLIVSAVLFMGLVIIGIGLFKDDPVEQEPNGLWIGTEWSYTPRDDDEVQDLVASLHQHRIGEVYVHVSELNFDGSWTGLPDGTNRFSEVEVQVGAFVQQLRFFYPELVLYGVVHVRTDVDDDGYRLDDETVWENVGAFSSGVIGRLAFDGVLLDVQPVWNNDENYLSLLRAVRDAIGDEPLMAIMVPPDWTPVDVDVPVPGTIAPGTVWELDYKRRVALMQVDRVIVRGYESYFSRAQNAAPDDYAAWLAYQVETYTNAIAYLQNDTRLLVALSTGGDVHIQDTVVVRDGSIETLPAAIDGIKNGMTGSGEDAAVFQGIVLVDNASTGEAEWQQFRNLWITR